MAGKKKGKGLEKPSSCISPTNALTPTKMGPAELLTPNPPSKPKPKGKSLEQPSSCISPSNPLTPTRMRPQTLLPPTPSKPKTIRRPYNCCQCTSTARHGGITCFRCNHQMCSECQVFSIETDVVLDPLPKIEPIVETPKKKEDNLPVSANTRSAQKKKISVLELGKLLEKSASMKEGMGRSEAGPKDLKGVKK